MRRRPPRSTLFPYTTLFRSATTRRRRGSRTSPPSSCAPPLSVPACCAGPRPRGRGRAAGPIARACGRSGGLGRRARWRMACARPSRGTGRGARRPPRGGRDETSCVNPEARHGCAGARPSDGGCGGPYRGPPRRSMSVVAPEVEAALRARARDYLRDNGTLAPTPVIRRRVTQAFESLEKLLRAADPARAARRAWPAEWSLHEIADHVVETHRPSRDELRDLLAGHRPVGPPIPASLQSKDPLARPWAAVLDDLGRVHADIVADLARAPDGLPTAVRARVVVVMNAAATDRGTVPPAWEDEIDRTAYAGCLRTPARDHLNQARKVLAALAGC